MFFSVITKNLNREILAKSLVTFRRWDRVKDEILMGGLLKNPIFRGRGSWKTNIYGGIT